MKKYLASLIPFIFCSVLAFAYWIKTPNPAFSYQSEANLHGLAFLWLVIGFIITCVFISMFIISDAFDWLTKKIEKMRMEKSP
jgi:uncharacterized membrane protein (DUF485 family)